MSMLSRTYCLLAFLMSTSIYAQTPFWYSSSGPVALKIDSLTISVKYDGGISPENGSVLDFERVLGVSPNLFAPDGFVVYTLSSSAGYGAFLDSVANSNGVDAAEPLYVSESGYPYAVGQSFCVEFESWVTNSQIDSMLSYYNVSANGPIVSEYREYLLNRTSTSPLDLLSLANLFHERPEVKYSHPNFVTPIQTNSYRLFDHFSDRQEHLLQTIGYFNDSAVWDFAGLSESTVVAVIDQGVVSHEDLPEMRVLPGYNAGTGLPDGSPGDDCFHGIACAGLIAASHTTDSIAGLEPSTGIVSMNPKAAILPVVIFGNDCQSNLVWAQLAEAINWAWRNGADVISNSWAFSDPYISAIPVIESAIDSAVTQGRSGLGSAVIFASGNAMVDPIVHYPARNENCIAVGGIDVEGYVWYYSGQGPQLDLVAPTGDVCLEGDVWTLDGMGAFGANPNVRTFCGPIAPWECPPTGIIKDNDENYNCRFGGTSAAAPLVSGVASLVLARNPQLTKDEVYEILIGSAYVDLDIWWEVPSSQYGYGRVDAFRAILSLARGDCNNSGHINPTDLTVLINHLFVDFEDLFPSNLLGDVDCDGLVNASDVQLLANHLFVTFEPLAVPCFEFGD